MLVTIWKRDRGWFKIVDAEMVMGDFFRPSGKAPSHKAALMRLMEVSDAWHAAVGFSVAHTLLAFEKKISTATHLNWRQIVGIPDADNARRKLNYAGISVLVNTHLKSIGLYIDPFVSDPELIESKKIVSRAIRLLANGQVDKALGRARIAPSRSTRNALKQLPSEWAKTLRTSLSVGSSSHFIVFLTPYKTTNLCLSMTIKRGQGRPVLDRIDLIDFQSFYAQVKKYQQNTKGGRR